MSAELHPDHAANFAYRDALHTILYKEDRGWLQLTLKDLKRELEMAERVVIQKPARSNLTGTNPDERNSPRHSHHGRCRHHCYGCVV